MRIIKPFLSLLLLALLLAMTILPGCTPSVGTDPNPPPTGEQTPPDNDDPPSTQDPPSNEDPPPPPAYEYSADISTYLPAIETAYSKDAMLLVNKTHPLSSLYRPDTLVILPTSDTYGGKRIELQSTAAAALKAMMLCMRADGITDAYVTSGYRDYNYQKNLHDSYVRKEQRGFSTDAYAYFGQEYIQKNYLDRGYTGLSAEDAKKVVLSYSAEPGTSEHQSGLCVDFFTSTMRELTNDQFLPTAAYTWLRENACQFGFILRFPEGKTDITGYAYESWHYRFVGREAAIAITQAGLTLEEYLAS